MADQREVTISLPEPVVQAATALAARESRTLGDLMGDLVTQHERTVRWQELMRCGEARAAAKGYTEQDVPRLLVEYRKKHAE